MRRAAVLLCCLSIVLAGTASGAGVRASLRIVSTRPAVVVAGAGFFPRERVRVTLTAGAAKRVRVVVSRAGGKFTARFDPVAIDPCTDDVGVTAVGARGDRAAAKLPARQCPPALRIP
jgi:hypothetical protein